MMIAAQRARQWREAEGLLDDDDFAYAYTDYDQVVGLAGHHVADDWLQTRARVEENLLAAGAKVVEDHPKGAVTLRPVRKTIFKKKPRAVEEGERRGFNVCWHGRLQASRHLDRHPQS